MVIEGLSIANERLHLLFIVADVALPRHLRKHNNPCRSLLLNAESLPGGSKRWRQAEAEAAGTRAWQSG